MNFGFFFFESGSKNSVTAWLVLWEFLSGGKPIFLVAGRGFFSELGLIVNVGEKGRIGYFN